MGIQWSEIKKQTPNAFKKLKKWINAETKGILQFELMMILKNERELFDFFDEMGIIISIWLQPQTRSHLVWSVYYSDIFAHSSKYYGDRKEAEKEAFKRAFKILEKK